MNRRGKDQPLHTSEEERREGNDIAGGRGVSSTLWCGILFLLKQWSVKANVQKIKVCQWLPEAEGESGKWLQWTWGIFLGWWEPSKIELYWWLTQLCKSLNSILKMVNFMVFKLYLNKVALKTISNRAKRFTEWLH